jgi:hypothetical protein
MDDVTAILLNGWFFESPDLQEFIASETNTIHEWQPSETESNAFELVWSDAEQLPENLLEAYKELAIKSKLRDWCRQSALWRSLSSGTHQTEIAHIMPLGSTASRIAALTLAGMLEVRGGSSLILPVVVRDENQEPLESLIQACAMRTWDWLKGKTGIPCLNLTLCAASLKSAYPCIGAFAREPFINKGESIEDIVILDWRADTESVGILPPADLDLSNRAFIELYLKGEDPRDAHSRRHYRTHFKSPMNSVWVESYRPVLEAWLDWTEEQINSDEGNSESPPPRQEQILSHPSVAV